MSDLRKNEHFGRMLETSELIWPMIETSLNTRMEHLGCQDLTVRIEHFLAKRRGKPLLRPYLTRIILDIFSEELWDTKSNLQLLAAVETINLSTYLANFAFDSKDAIILNDAKSAHFIAAMISLSLACNFETSEQEQVNTRIKAILRCNEEVYAGQYLDICVLNLRNSEIEGNLVTFTKQYLQRCRLLCGSTMMLAMLPMSKVALSDDIRQAVTALLLSFGAAVQSINDLSDAFPDAQRFYSTPYFDLRNQRLTLPYLLLLHAGVALHDLRHIAECIDRQDVQLKLCSLLAEHRIIDSGRAFIRTHYWPQIRNSLQYIKRKHPTYALRYLQFIPHLLFCSRMYDLPRFYSGKTNESQELL